MDLHPLDHESRALWHLELLGCHAPEDAVAPWVPPWVEESDWYDDDEGGYLGELVTCWSCAHVIAQDTRTRRHGERVRPGDPAWRPSVPHAEREVTPPQLAEWLVELARRCNVNAAHEQALQEVVR